MLTHCARTLHRRLRSQLPALATSARRGVKKMPDRPPPVAEAAFTEVFLKGSGPGGQKINKTSSAVQLRHRATGLVLKVQDTRSRAQNRKIARERLALQLELLEKGDASRLAVVGATKSKRKASAVKKSKRKYRLLEEQKKQERAGKGETVPEDPHQS
ncbi:hypothetical protein K3495_g9226 [Podosphaera aphanis]|nr:hypothetical protein K3495_g9226 [Podosphaera aphanis]